MEAFDAFWGYTPSSVQRYASPLGAFQGKMRHLYELVFLYRPLIQPEDYPANPSLYDNHLSQWNVNRMAWGLPMWGCTLCHVEDYNGEWTPLWPDGYSLPEGMTYKQMPRFPSLEEIQTAFWDGYVGLTPFPPEVVISIDWTYPLEIEDAIDPDVNGFGAWLTSNNVKWNDYYEFDDRQWLFDVNKLAYIEVYGSDWYWYHSSFGV